MKKNNFKMFLAPIFVLTAIISLFFISNKKVSADLQVQDDMVVVKTTGYSVLSTTNFVFNGYYSGNSLQEGFTTYFEFKKGTIGNPMTSVDFNSSLNENPKKTTQKIIHIGQAKISNDFFISPKLDSSSFYYFRAVGYFNDNPEKKFYGDILSIDTFLPVNLVTSSKIPFSIDKNGNLLNYISPTSDADVLSESSDKIICSPPDVLDKIAGFCRNTDIVVETVGYSVLSQSDFTFNGHYSGNYKKRPFNNYFEYVKIDSITPKNINDVWEGKWKIEKTIEIRRSSGKTEEYNDFHIDQPLRSISTYYFRAVGYFRDSDGQKFYGNTLVIKPNMQAGVSMPFSVDKTGEIIEYVKPKPDIVECKLPNNLDNKGVCCYFPKEVENGVCGSSIGSITIDNPSNICTLDNNGYCCDLPQKVDKNGDCTTTNVVNNNNGGSGVKYDFKDGIVICKSASCGFTDLMKLINRVINYALFVLFIPIAAILFAYAGFMMLTSGGEVGKKKKALSVFWNVGLGLVIALASWLIINTLLSILGFDGSWIGFK
jgi:hypothetical protein